MAGVFDKGRVRVDTSYCAANDDEVVTLHSVPCSEIHYPSVADEGLALET